MYPDGQFCLCLILFLISRQNLAFNSMSRFNLICLKFARFSSDEKSSLSTYVPRRPILPLFDPFSLSVCAVRHPISIQPHLAFISKWWRGTMVALFSVPLFFLLPFFTSKLVEPHQTDSIAHLIAQCYKRQIFFLSLTDKRRLFDRKFVFRGPTLIKIFFDDSY